MSILNQIFVAGRTVTVALLAGVLAGQANATPITGGTTSVAVTDLHGLSALPIGSASIGEPIPGSLVTVDFPITGGTLDGDDTTIEHEGSGLLLSSDNGASARVEDFFISFALDILVTIATPDGEPAISDYVLFTAGAGDEIPGGVQLLISDRFGEDIEQFFGLENAAGQEFGYAFINPDTTPVSTPGSVLLMLGSLGWLRARGKRVA